MCRNRWTGGGSNATRAGVHGLIKTLSQEIAATGVTVNAVCPGTIRTDRIMELAQQLVQQGDLKEIVVDDISVEEGRAAAEMMLVGSSIKVAPVVQWDGQPIGDGKPGPIAKKLLDLWNEDRISAADQLIPLTYAEQ